MSYGRLQVLRLKTSFICIALTLSVIDPGLDMASVFKVIEHSIPGQHIREYPKGTKHRQEDTLQLCIKHYIPASTPDVEASKGLTIIGAAGNGFPKVLTDCGCFLDSQRQR